MTALQLHEHLKDFSRETGIRFGTVGGQLAFAVYGPAEPRSGETTMFFNVCYPNPPADFAKDGTPPPNGFMSTLVEPWESVRARLTEHIGAAR